MTRNNPNYPQTIHQTRQSLFHTIQTLISQILELSLQSCQKFHLKRKIILIVINQKKKLKINLLCKKREYKYLNVKKKYLNFLFLYDFIFIFIFILLKMLLIF
jgi:hypothetical protein